ncbi:CoA transferase [Delftia tsuruhatensis]
MLEFAGLGPAPFACMLLSDMGAEVVCVDRPQARLGDARNVMQRGRTVVQADLKSPEGRGRRRSSPRVRTSWWRDSALA